MNKNDLYKAARKKWGTDAVIAKAIEECGELVAVLAKYHVNGEIYGRESDPFDIHHKQVDEIADVTIMMEQLRLIFGTSWIDERKAEKLERLEQLVRDES